jgi:ribonuclease P protein component
LLPKDERITRGGEIKRILGRREIEASTPLLYLIAAQSATPKSRVATVITKKIGKAVVRNRIRRLLVEAYARIKHKLAKNYDLVFIAKGSALDKSMAGFEDSLVMAMRKAGIKLI